MVKRILALVLAIVMAIGMMLSFTGCPVKEKERDDLPTRYRVEMEMHNREGEYVGIISLNEKSIIFNGGGKEYTFDIVSVKETYQYYWGNFMRSVLSFESPLRYEGKIKGVIKRELPGGQIEVGEFSVDITTEAVSMTTDGYVYSAKLSVESLGDLYCYEMIK